MPTKLFVLVSLVALSGCTDAEVERLLSYGSQANIKCYSGGVVIYEGMSTGKVISEKNSDGYLFRDASDQKLREVSGNCVITYTE